MLQHYACLCMADVGLNIGDTTQVSDLSRGICVVVSGIGESEGMVIRENVEKATFQKKKNGSVGWQVVHARRCCSVSFVG